MLRRLISTSPRTHFAYLSRAMSTKIGIIGALPEEIAVIQEHVEVIREHKFGSIFTIYEGRHNNRDIVYSLSNVGMVFASSVSTIMITQFAVDAVVFTGVAGALKAEHKIGDLIIADDVINYDMDCTRFELPNVTFLRGQIPFLGWRAFTCDPSLKQLALDAPGKTQTRTSTIIYIYTYIP